MESDQSRNVQRGIFRGWIVIACCFCMTLTFGVSYSYSDFFLPLAREFGWNHATNSTIPAVSLLVFSFGSLFGGYIVSRAGYRNLSFLGSFLVGAGIILSSQINGFYELLLCFGVIAPLGSAFVVIVATSLAVKWFTKRRGIAVGLMVSGSGFGTLTIPPIVEGLIGNTFEWRNAFLLLGIAFLILLSVASFFMQTPEDLKLEPYGVDAIAAGERNRSKDFTLKRALNTTSFWMIYSMFFLGTMGATLFLAEAAPFASTYGIEAGIAATALGVFGAGSLVARLAVGILSERLGRRSILLSSFLPEFICLALLPLAAGNILSFFLASFGIGFGYGGFLSSFVSMTGDLFGSKWTQRIWGIQETAYGFGGLVGPISAGLFFDSFQTYTGIIEISAFGVLTAVALSIFFPRSAKKLAQNQTT